MVLGLYLALSAAFGLIIRGVSFEYRGKIDTRAGGRPGAAPLTVGSLLLPVLLGIALGDLLYGLPIDSSGEYTGSFWDLLTPYGLWMGLTLLSLTLLHGSTFLTLRTTGIVNDRARRLTMPSHSSPSSPCSSSRSGRRCCRRRATFPDLFKRSRSSRSSRPAWAVRDRHDGWAFSATAIAIALAIVTIFVDLYPNVMVSSTSSDNNLTVANTASGNYALKVMTVVAVVLFPVVLVYQIWNFHVFRHRIASPKAEAETPSPQAVPQETI